MRVTKNVHALRLPFAVPVAPGKSLDRFVYAFLVFGEGICLIDTGVAASAEAIFDYIGNTGLRPEDIGLVVQTHSHPDHIGSTKKIKELAGCTVAAHARPWIEDVGLQLRERPVPGFNALVGGSTRVDRLLCDGDVLELGDGVSIEVMHTPGHSKDSISLFLGEEGALIAGDAVPVPGGFPIYDDFRASVTSVKRLMGVDGVDVLLSSWDEPRKGADMRGALEGGLGYLRRIHEAVEKASAGEAMEPMELCRRTVGLLGLPPAAVNPLVARSFMSNLEVISEGIDPGF